jgi:hypothetical protein
MEAECGHALAHVVNNSIDSKRVRYNKLNSAIGCPGTSKVIGDTQSKVLK